jgi:TetR/AcrR family transcriptional regulator, mexJK operon transcriptional repressor
MSNINVAPETARRGRPRDLAKDEAIIEAAGHLFLERGFDAASLDAVAQAAGVSKATIYARYKDKDELFCAVLANKCEPVTFAEDFTATPDRPLRESLIGFARSFMALILDDEPVRLHRVITAEGPRSPRVAELFMENAVVPLKDRLASWIEAEVRSGRLKTADPMSAAWRFLGALKGEAFMRASIGLPAGCPAELDRYIAACVDDFLRANS